MIRYRVNLDAGAGQALAPVVPAGWLVVGVVEAPNAPRAALARCSFTGYHGRAIGGRITPLSDWAVLEAIKRARA